MQTKTYVVKKDFPWNGKIRRVKDEVDMSDFQARHLRIGNFIEPKVSRETPKTATPTTSHAPKDKK